jgi:hypothetical protein
MQTCPESKHGRLTGPYRLCGTTNSANIAQRKPHKVNSKQMGVAMFTWNCKTEQGRSGIFCYSTLRRCLVGAFCHLSHRKVLSVNSPTPSQEWWTHPMGPPFPLQLSFPLFQSPSCRDCAKLSDSPFVNLTLLRKHRLWLAGLAVHNRLELLIEGALA